MFDSKSPRRVVPRWRSSAITALLPEARAASAGKKHDLSVEVDQKKSDFRRNGTLPVAAELMFLSMTADDEPTAKAAAKFILSSELNLKSTRLFRVATQLVMPDVIVTRETDPKEFVRESRLLLGLDYRNPILLMDVAHALTSLGEPKAALKYVRSALVLAPQSRFVVRAAARYFLHTKDLERAHSVLCSFPMLSVDPWVLASEIAVSTVRGKTSTFAKKAMRRLEALTVIGPDKTELASALATIEMIEGANKKAKALFKKALVLPNENSLAQAEWASRDLRLFIDQGVLKTPRSFEANCKYAYRQLLIDDAIKSASMWAEDEAFSSRPLDYLAYLYSLSDQFAAAKSASDASARLNPSDNIVSRLNLVYLKIQEGQLEGLQGEIDLLARHQDARSHSTQFAANAGALAYSTGSLQQAREFYCESIKNARKKGDHNGEALASAFFARAAIRHADPKVDQILSESHAIVQKSSNPGAIYVMSRLVEPKIRRELEEKAKLQIPLRQWQWDAISNTLKALDS